MEGSTEKGEGKDLDLAKVYLWFLRNDLVLSEVVSHSFPALIGQYLRIYSSMTVASITFFCYLGLGR